MVGAIQTDFVVSPGTARFHHDTRFLPHITPTQGPDYIRDLDELSQVAVMDLGDISNSNYTDLHRVAVEESCIENPRLILGIKHDESNGSRLAITERVCILTLEIFDLYKDKANRSCKSANAYVVDGSKWTAGF